MPTKYAIEIKESNLDLIEMLNGGVRPEIEGDTYFIFTADKTTPNEISTEDNLYTEDGYTKDELTWVW